MCNKNKGVMVSLTPSSVVNKGRDDRVLQQAADPLRGTFGAFWGEITNIRIVIDAGTSD